MPRYASLLSISVFLLFCSCGSEPSPPQTVQQEDLDAPQEEGVRDPLRHPFHSRSPWNHPIGDAADYVEAKLEASTRFGVFVEEEILILRPQAPLTAIFESHADWKKGADRSKIDGPELIQAPMPKNFVTRDFIGDTPNHAATILMPDGRTLHHSQPFHREQEGEPATSHYVFPDSDLYGEGLSGAHGGSGLSALGGCIRLGELVPGTEIRHSLKLVIPNRYFHYRRDGSPGYRWPATKADGYASPLSYRGRVKGLEMGALLALHPDFPIDELQTEPAKILARALRDYGAYTCDSTGWDASYLATEWSPEGRVLDEFEKTWGFPYVMKDLNHPWSQDHKRMLESLYLIQNNSPERTGGGGVLRRPLLPELRPPEQP